MAITLPKIEAFYNDVNERERECMNAEQAARFLGISATFLRKHLDEIPHKRIGERVLFGRRALLDWLNNKNGNDKE